MTASMRLAENGGERDFKNLVVEIVADMHDPVAPVLRARFHDHRAHHAGGVIAGLGEVTDHDAELIDANFAGTGAVEIDLGHLRSPAANLLVLKIPAADSAEYSGTFPTGIYGHVPQRDSSLAGWDLPIRDPPHADSR